MKYLKLSVGILFFSLTINIQANLLEKCIKNKSDINNNGTVSKFEKMMCERASKGKRLGEEGKRLDDEGKRLGEEGKKLDEENERLRQAILDNLSNID